MRKTKLQGFPFTNPSYGLLSKKLFPNSQNSENIFHRKSFPKTIHASFKGNFPRKRLQVITNEQRKIVEDRWNLRQSEHQRSAVLLSYESSKLLLALFNSLLVFLAHGRVRLSHAEIKTKKESERNRTTEEQSTNEFSIATRLDAPNRNRFSIRPKSEQIGYCFHTHPLLNSIGNDTDLKLRKKNQKTASDPIQYSISECDL